MSRIFGFEPFADDKSRVLVLGSFPSVKSRAQGFYYGNPQNRFWKTVCSFFADPVPDSLAGKKEFLLKRHIALWDVVMSCEIKGSQDVSIREEEIADIPMLLEKYPIQRILCNGSKAYELFEKNYPELIPVSRKLSSTSPANPRFSLEEWHRALGEVFL